MLFAHPALQKSRVQRRLISATEGLPSVTVHDLYERYPDLMVDARAEQALLLEHDVIVFQHPFYWYSSPAIMKEWQDLVLEHGWAYGAGGTKLRDKITFNVISTGGPVQAYQKGGYNRFTMRELLAPWDQTAHLCGMRFLAPFVVHAALKLVSDAVGPQAEAYRRVIEAIRDDKFDFDAAEQAENMLDIVDSLIGKRGQAAAASVGNGGLS